MKNKITTLMLLASVLIGNSFNAQEDINDEYLKWAEDGKLAEVKTYLAKGADINFINEYGRGAGEVAIWNIQKDNGALITYLLDHGLKVDYLNPDGNNLLHVAAEYKGSAVFKKLIDKGIAIDAFTENGETAVFIAAENEDFEAVKLLASLGANLQSTNKDGETLLKAYDLKEESLWNDLMSFKLSKEQLNKLLVKCVDDIESLEKVKQLVAKGAAVNTSNEDNIPLIHLAAQLESTAILSYLIEIGADVNATDEDGYNALWEVDNLEAMTILLDKGVDPNQKVDDELLIAQYINYASVAEVKLLVSKGADLNLKTDEETILTYSKSLLKLEHRPGAKYADANAQAEADKAYKTNINEIIKFIETKGAK